MFGTMAGQHLTVVKDDGCNKNVVSSSFVNRNRHFLNIEGTSAETNHSSRKTTEHASELVIDAELKLGNHTYRSIWIVSDCRYDIMLGMPRNVKHRPTVNYETGEVRVRENVMPNSHHSDRAIRFHNLGVKKFRSLLRKKKKNSKGFCVYQVRIINQLSKPTSPQNKSPVDKELEGL